MIPTIAEKSRAVAGVPDHSFIVEEVWNRGGWTLTTHDGAGQFCEAVVIALHAYDPNWGHLRKYPPRTHYNGHGIDVALYRPAGKTADFIVNAGTSVAEIGWGINAGDAYPESDWYAPTLPEPGGGEPTPLPPDTVIELLRATNELLRSSLDRWLELRDSIDALVQSVTELTDQMHNGITVRHETKLFALAQREEAPPSTPPITGN